MKVNRNLCQAAKSPAPSPKAIPQKKPLPARQQGRGSAVSVWRRQRQPQPWAVVAGSLALVVLGCLFLLLFLGRLRDEQETQVYYTELARQAVSPAEDSSAASRIDFAFLQSQNPDTVGWLELPGQALNLPLVRHADDRFYLSHGFDGTARQSGCLFLAAEYPADWSAVYNIVYGHNMRNDSMFGGLNRYADPAFCAEYPVFTLYTPDQTYLCRVFSCHATQEGSDVYTNSWVPGADYDSFLQELKDLSDYDTGVEVPSGSRVLTLSTCKNAYGSGRRRFVIHAVLEPLDQPVDQPAA